MFFSSYVGGVNGSGTWTAVHLLSAEEVKGLFEDVVRGLAFLVSWPYNSICLHLTFLRVV
jgi:hypothetical protein